MSVRPSAHLSHRPSVHPSVRRPVWQSISQSVLCYFRAMKIHFLCSDDDEICHWPRDSQGQFLNQNVGPSVCPSIQWKKMNKKCRQGSRILRTPRFLFKKFFAIFVFPPLFIRDGFTVFMPSLKFRSYSFHRLCQWNLFMSPGVFTFFFFFGTNSFTFAQEDCLFYEGWFFRWSFLDAFLHL